MLFLEQDSTTVPKFAYRSFCPGGNLVGECLPQTLLMRLTPLENLRKFFSDFFKNSSAAHPVFLLLVSGHHAQEATVNAEKFMNVVRKYLSIEELTHTLLREMVEKIVVYECEYDENEVRRQRIDIYYSFVGKVELPDE